MQHFPTVQDYMDTRSHSISNDTDILDAVDYLLKNHVTGVPVLDDGGNVIGLLNERDCLKVIAGGSSSQMGQGNVSTFVSKNFQCIPPTMDIYYAAGLFLKEENASIRRFLVLDDGKLIGVITRYDILRAIQAQR